MKAVKLLVLFLFCMGEMHAIGIDSIQTYVEINRIKVLVEWSGYGCYHPTDSVILDDVSGEVRIYRTETVPECDMVTHNTDSFYVKQGAFDELKIQLYKRSMSGGTDEMPLYGEYFCIDSYLLDFTGTSVWYIKQNHRMYYDQDECFFQIQSDADRLYKVIITSLDGKLIEQNQVISNESISLAHLLTGTYLLIVDNSDVFRIMKK